MKQEATLDHLTPDRLNAVLEWRNYRVIDSVIMICDHPYSQSKFAQNLRSVLEIAGLPVSSAEEYVQHLYGRYHWLRDAKTWHGSVFGAFDTLNGWALHDCGLDFVKDQAVIKLVRDSLWLTLTGMNPNEYYNDEHELIERLQRQLGIRDVRI